MGHGGEVVYGEESFKDGCCQVSEWREDVSGVRLGFFDVRENKDARLDYA